MMWTPEDIERVRTLAADGWSAAQIAGEIGGVSRNAVVGVGSRNGVHFLGTSNGIQNTRATRPPPQFAPKGPVLVSQPPEDEPYQGSRMLTFDELNLSTECRYAFGDRDFRFCGRPAMEGKPYCFSHCGLCYTLPAARIR
jgi:GcrA cell cycle regulator